MQAVAPTTMTSLNLGLRESENVFSERKENSSHLQPANLSHFTEEVENLEIRPSEQANSPAREMSPVPTVRARFKPFHKIRTRSTKYKRVCEDICLVLATIVILSVIFIPPIIYFAVKVSV